jgi:hypothetical protein
MSNLQIHIYAPPPTDIIDGVDMVARGQPKWCYPSCCNKKRLTANCENVCYEHHDPDTRCKAGKGCKRPGYKHRGRHW